MRLLLDTHVAIWAVLLNPLLTRRGRELIEDASNEVFVSAVSLWEIAIKHRVARRATSMPISCEQAVRAFRQAGFESLGVTASHAAAVEQLPMLHGDPFDHLLLAQAQSEPMRLVTHDVRLASYDSSIIRI